ncbi:MAG: hypothetical protein AB7Q17_08715 [Phycisphaerae bacterium]
MTFDELRALPAESLEKYLRRRLRCDPPLDPPLDLTHRQEPPEDFVIRAAHEEPDPVFRARLLDAVRANYRRLVLEQLALPAAQRWRAPVDDQHVASLAFLCRHLNLRELVDDLYWLATGWARGALESASTATDGQYHTLKALAHFQDDRAFAPLWERLWTHGPRSLRAFLISAWARADKSAALARLEELCQSATEIDLPGALWTLVMPPGPGIEALRDAALRLPPERRAQLAAALDTFPSYPELAARLRDPQVNPAKKIAEGGGPAAFQFPGVPQPKNGAARRLPALAAADALAAAT